MIKSKNFRSDEELMSKINRKINAKYKFIGYQSFINLISKWETELKHMTLKYAIILKIVL